MKRVLIFVFLVILLSLPVRAMEFSAPPPPDSAAELMPKTADSFGEGLWNVVSAGLKLVSPSMSEAAQCCLRVLGAALLIALVRQMAPSVPGQALELAGVAAGGVSASAALYVGTAFFNALLTAAVTTVFLPMLWMLLALSIAHAAVGESILEKLRDLLKWLMEWSLKLSLYLFTGYMAITGVVSGTADAAAGKAVRIAISGAVPVVGGILSDAADAVLLSAAAMGSGAGMWGILTVLALFAAPAVRIGCQYLMLRLTAAVGESLGGGRCAALAGDFAGAMGLLLALVSTQTAVLLVSSLCFLRGVAA